MANQDKATGFNPIGTLAGGSIPRPVEFILTTSEIVYEGDPVIVTSTGTVTHAEYNSTTTLLGVAAEYVYDSGGVGGLKVKVYVDPNIIYEVQANAAYAVTDVFSTANTIAYAVGSSATKKSLMELDTFGTSTGAWLVLGLVDSPDNAWGAHQKVKVVINNGVRITAYAGI
mgnify:CR=1 FL=1